MKLIEFLDTPIILLYYGLVGADLEIKSFHHMVKR